MVRRCGRAKNIRRYIIGGGPNGNRPLFITGLRRIDKPADAVTTVDTNPFPRLIPSAEHIHSADLTDSLISYPGAVRHGYHTGYKIVLLG